MSGEAGVRPEQDAHEEWPEARSGISPARAADVPMFTTAPVAGDRRGISQEVPGFDVPP
ncbi:MULTISPECIES: hypothetical protein [Streptomyces]|uniref:hypothetical protein n=1 Tax=Streptomyces lycopersici TaxID=2974589 RepID=UPI0021CEF274|nr:hypothetical protein [Streptomyces sp. NEAU-383]